MSGERRSPTPVPGAPTGGTRSTRRGWASPSGSGATPRPRRSSWPTAASTSPAPTTGSPRSWPTAASGSCPGTSGATATPTAPALYSWDADLRDAVAVLDSLGGIGPLPAGRPLQGRRPAAATGRGPARTGSATWSTSTGCRRARPARRARTTSAPGCSPVSCRAGSTTAAAAAGKQRRPGTIDELAERRRPHEPPPARSTGCATSSPSAASSDEDGWRWKIDPTLRLRRLRPVAARVVDACACPACGMPVLGVLGLEPEVMGWGTPPEDVEPYLPPGARVRGPRGVGHFVHIEQPAARRRPGPASFLAAGS